MDLKSPRKERKAAIEKWFQAEFEPSSGHRTEFYLDEISSDLFLNLCSTAKEIHGVSFH